VRLRIDRFGANRWLQLEANVRATSARRRTAADTGRAAPQSSRPRLRNRRWRHGNRAIRRTVQRFQLAEQMSATTTAPPWCGRSRSGLPRSCTPMRANARTHSPEQVAQIAASIREFGFVNPVLVDASGGMLAAWTPAGGAPVWGGRGPGDHPGSPHRHQRRAYIIADNKLALMPGGTWSCWRRKCARSSRTTLTLRLIGFSKARDGRVAGRRRGARAGGRHQEAIPEAPANPVTQPGDVW